MLLNRLSIESVAYVLYTTILARFLGAVGVALGFVFLFNGSLLWQVIILRYKTGNSGGRTVLISFTRTGLAALVGGMGRDAVYFQCLASTYIWRSVWVSVYGVGQ